MTNSRFSIRLSVIHFLLAGLFLISGMVFHPVDGLARHREIQARFAQNGQGSCDNKAFLKAQQEFENSHFRPSVENIPVHVCGRVITASYARKTRSGVHGYFYLDVGSGVSIRIVNNLDEMTAPRWPWVRKGDYAEVVGRYYYDSPRKQGIDWTHKGTGRKWPYAGYVIVNGNRYE